MRTSPERREGEPTDGARRWLVRLIFVFYLALLGEGVLRKWVLPDASNALVFLRDPLMLLIFVAYWRTGPTAAMRGMLGLFGTALLAFALCAGCQALTTDVPGLVLLVGLRNYFFFAPLCFAIRDAFTADDYRRWIKLNLALAAPIAILVFFQYRASPAALINAVPGGGNEGVFLLVEDVVRPYGVFSFSLGHSAYAGWMTGLGFATIAGWRGLRLGPALPVLGLAGIAVMGVLSGSRTYFVFAASVAACFVAIAVICGPNRAKMTGLAATAGVAALGAGALVALPSLADNLAARQNAAVASEGSTGHRLIQIVTEFASEAERVPLFGFGLGSGTNIAAFLANGRTDHILAEYELTRIVQELGPMFGGLYILLRWGLLAWLAKLSLGAAVRGNLQPACFLGFLIPVFLAHDITLQNTMIGIGWFAAGILMSAEKVGAQLSEAPAEPSRRLLLHGAAV